MFRTRLNQFSIVVVALIFVACTQPVPIEDSPEARLEQARALTAVEVESGALDEMLDEGAALAREATADMLMLELEREPSEDDLAQLETVLRAGLAEFLTADLWQEVVSEVYAENFTASELQAAVEFYNSPTGRKILSMGQRLDDEVGNAVEAALEIHNDEFVAMVDAALAERFPEVVEEGP